MINILQWKILQNKKNTSNPSVNSIVVEQYHVRGYYFLNSRNGLVLVKMQSDYWYQTNL